jgi:hypothetical protein
MVAGQGSGHVSPTQVPCSRHQHTWSLIVQSIPASSIGGVKEKERPVISSLEEAKRARERNHCVLKSLRPVSLGEVIGTALKRAVLVVAGLGVLDGVVVG